MENGCQVKLKILIVDDEKEILLMLKKYFEQKSYEVITAESAEEALKKLEVLSGEINLVLTDYRLPKMNGIDLLKMIRSMDELLPVIIMTAYGHKNLILEAIHNRCDGFIEKPFEMKDLNDEITRVQTTAENIIKKYKNMASAGSGSIQGITLATFLQAVRSEEKTWKLEIEAGDKSGKLFFWEGELIDAETKNKKGEDAAIEIIGWDDAVITIHNMCTKKRIIESSLTYLLFEAFRVKDEKQQEIKKGEDLLEKSVNLACGRHFKEARQLLIEYLGLNPLSDNGWLWYSRVVKSMKVIETSIDNAIRIAPGKKELLEEREKFTLAKKELAQTEARRCPFCWSPIDEKAKKCNYCMAFLSIHQASLLSEKTAQKQIIEQAITRYESVINREKNIKAHYYCGIAHLNLGNREDGLNQLHMAVNLAPKNAYLMEELRLLLGHMDSNGISSEQEANLKQKVPKTGTGIEKIGEKAKVLIVEDSFTTRKVIAITLSRKGYIVIEAEDGLEALSKVNETRPDLILLDIILPKMDGYKVLSIIKNNKDFKDIPVIMLTSKDSYEHQAKGKLAGSTAYLTKPFDPVQLLDMIENTLVNVPMLQYLANKNVRKKKRGF